MCHQIHVKCSHKASQRIIREQLIRSKIISLSPNILLEVPYQHAQMILSTDLNIWRDLGTEQGFILDWRPRQKEYLMKRSCLVFIRRPWTNCKLKLLKLSVWRVLRSGLWLPFAKLEIWTVVAKLSHFGHMPPASQGQLLVQTEPNRPDHICPDTPY